MQALGSYAGGRMLFLGLGTGLGSTMILDGVLAPMELGNLAYKKDVWEHYVGEAGLERMGHNAGRRWCSSPSRSSRPRSAGLRRPRRRERAQRQRAPAHCRLGHNEDAFLGGFRLWSRTEERRRERG